MNKERRLGAFLSYINIVMKNLVTFMYTPFLLRFVGQANYGLFQMTNSVMVSLSLLSMGFSSAYVRFYIAYKVKKDKRKIEKLNGMYLLIFLGISLLSLLIGIALVANVNHLFNKSLTPHQLLLTRYLMSVMVIDVAVTFISSVFDSNITVNQRFTFQQGRQLMQTFLVPLICVPLVLVGVGVLSIVITQLLVTTLFMFLNVRYCLVHLNMKFSFSNLPFGLLKELGAFSFFIFLNQIVDLVNNNVPNFILGMFRGARMVATFAIAVQVKNMFFMLSTSLSNVFVPRVNELVSSHESNDVLTELMVKIGRIQMSVLFFVFGGFVVVGKYFVDLWAGSENSEAYILVIIMVLPSIIPLSQNIGIEIQRAMNKHMFRSIVYIIFAMVNIVITILGSIYFGLIGASLGYVVSILCANGILMNWYYQKKIHLNMIFYWRSILSTCIPFLIVVVALLLVQRYVRINSILVFILFGGIYVVFYMVIYLMFIANSYEKSLIKSMIKH
ncbi:lipopolysaccharide biosynthesis protein [Levilactobacillus sp. HBUAS70063]|uniref:lipopolysaccharide biosynthesis protein n=1 Tax=Levilactobacillus sp. HBUAS70063 TaxID=3109359 RepID=UPI003132C6A1